MFTTEFDNEIKNQLTFEEIPMSQRNPRTAMTEARLKDNVSIRTRAKACSMSESRLNHIELGAVPWLTIEERELLAKRYKIDVSGIHSVSKKPRRNFVASKKAVSGAGGRTPRKRLSVVEPKSETCLLLDEDEALLLATYLSTDTLVKLYTDGSLKEADFLGLTGISAKARKLV